MTQKTSNRAAFDHCAETILETFEHYRGQFQAITRRAKTRFEKRDWPGIKADAAERLDLYTTVVHQTADRIRRLLGKQFDEKETWMRAKTAYSALSRDVDVWELAETFFNSVTRRIFDTVGVDPRIEFVDTCSRARTTVIGGKPFRVYENSGSTRRLIESILGDYRHKTDYEDLQRDARQAAVRVDALLRTSNVMPIFERAEILNSVLYRGKGAYLVGRIVAGSEIVPLVLALLNSPAGVVVDALLLSENDVSILFSFTRAYFHVDVERPAELVRFLKSIMPRKRVAELYISIGYNKHGKSELYCDLLQHLSRSERKFEIAEGERGMVMEVFTMPDYDLVFKVIKDRFAYPKNTTRDTVMSKYSLVFRHDRVGRLVDAQEFEHLKFSRLRFSGALLNSLQRNAAQNLTVDGDDVVIRHAYVERRVTPLDIYLGQVGDAEARLAVKDLGYAIKDLAATNIFPGDMLLKNFGVTRHGRVVFYDYDELCLLSSCNFRAMPRARSYEDELAAEPWFSIGENDVFPEEFQKFIGLQGPLRDYFADLHKDLFDVHFWRGVQSRNKSGDIMDFFPYEQDKRLARGPG